MSYAISDECIAAAPARPNARQRHQVGESKSKSTPHLHRCGACAGVVPSALPPSLGPFGARVSYWA
jgi:hypothetical protein